MRPRRLSGLMGALLVLLPVGPGTVTSQDAPGPVFHTPAGPLPKDEVGDGLAHHHMFVELGAAPATAYLDADPEIVYEVIGPWVEDAKELGIGVFVEFSPEGIGRRPDIVKYVADQAGLPTMLVTGVGRFVRGVSASRIDGSCSRIRRCSVDSAGVGSTPSSATSSSRR